MSLVEIAQKRGLVASTIEGHLAELVHAGEVDIGALIEEGARKRIADQIVLLPENASLREIKDHLGSAVTYGEIRFVLADLHKE